MKDIWDRLLNIIIVLCILSLVLIVTYQMMNGDECKICSRFADLSNIENFTTTTSTTTTTTRPKITMPTTSTTTTTTRYKGPSTTAPTTAPTTTAPTTTTTAYTGPSTTTASTTTTLFEQAISNADTELSNTVTDILNQECTSADGTNCQSGIFEANYNKNILPFLKNQIDIDDLSNKIGKINSKLERELHKKTLVTASGEMKFY
jgi:hypothetical protein